MPFVVDGSVKHEISSASNHFAGKLEFDLK
jgi:hypothetical protein